MTAIVRYSVLRVGVFLAAVALFSVLGAGWVLNLALSTVVALAVSYLFLGRQREAVAQLVARRVEHVGSERVEDDVLDRADAQRAEAPVAVENAQGADAAAVTASDATGPRGE